MNTLGTYTDLEKNQIVNQMFRCAGHEGKVVIGCWQKESLKRGYEEFYKYYPELCGDCKESDFNFVTGDFHSSTSDYSSHWWSEKELRDIIY